MNHRCPDCGDRLRSGLRVAAAKADRAQHRQQWAADTVALAARILADLPADPAMYEHREAIA